MNETSCPTCGAKVILCGDQGGAILLVDRDPVAGAEMVLRRSINSAPMAMRATSLDIGTRYRTHRCLRPTRIAP